MKSDVSAHSRASFAQPIISDLRRSLEMQHFHVASSIFMNTNSWHDKPCRTVMIFAYMFPTSCIISPANQKISCAIFRAPPMGCLLFCAAEFSMSSAVNASSKFVLFELYGPYVIPTTGFFIMNVTFKQLI